MSIITRYLRGAILRGTVVAVAVLVGLFSFFTFLDEVDEDFVYAVRKTLLTLPTIVYEVVPMCALLGALIGLGSLAQNRELVALRAAGLSTRCLALAVAWTAVSVIAAGMAIGELVAPAALTEANLLDASREERDAGRSSETPTWINDGRRFVRIGNALDARTLEHVAVYEFDAAGRLVASVAASRARFDGSDWLLEDVRETRLVDGTARTLSIRELPWQFTLAPAVVSMVAIAPERLTLPELARYIVEMRGTTQSAERYVEAFWRRLSYPLAALAMVMIALPLVLTPEPRGSGGRRIFIGAGVGIGFYLANELSSHLATVYGVPAVAAALGPTVVLASAAALLNLRRPQRM